jgi:hypothetical protein
MGQKRCLVHIQLKLLKEIEGLTTSAIGAGLSTTLRARTIRARSLAIGRELHLRKGIVTKELLPWSSGLGKKKLRLKVLQEKKPI